MPGESPVHPQAARSGAATTGEQMNPEEARSGEAATGKKNPTILVIACGALAREVKHLLDVNGWSHVTLTCLPADLHNRPQLIPEAMRKKIRAARDRYDRIVALYGDCGTGGLLDDVLDAEGVDRIPGPHCYQFYMGTEPFTEAMDKDPCSFFLTDYLARHFDRLIIQGLGLDRYPQLLDDYFGHYTRLIYLAQTDDPELDAAARAGAERLGLAYERRFTGYGELETFLAQTAGADGSRSEPAAVGLSV